ncbi:hypothetical protein [Streptomyces sp. URMC 129]|uniref:hypothetical protein n=1 Tax=Streptomyces sp. URMC 129 TaxID=3423407 RepID=UPI003F1E22F2
MTFRQAIGDLCGVEIDAKTYVGFFVNDCGEYLVFTQKPGEKSATLYHSDADWEPQLVSQHSIKVGAVMPGAITVGDLIIHQAEASWLSACLDATTWHRGGSAAKG